VQRTGRVYARDYERAQPEAIVDAFFEAVGVQPLLASGTSAAPVEHDWADGATGALHP
jgi:hypothetical protein